MSDQGPSRQDRALFVRNKLILLLVVLSMLSVNACGKKPGRVDPPVGVTNDTYPLTYPDVNTDPKPDTVVPQGAKEKKK